jgi:hypothetical protein
MATFDEIVKGVTPPNINPEGLGLTEDVVNKTLESIPPIDTLMQGTTQPLIPTTTPQSSGSFMDIIGAQPTQEDSEAIQKAQEEVGNSFRNRFAISMDNTQASLFKGLDLVADVMKDTTPEASTNLKAYAQRGIKKNKEEALSKPQPTRAASFTDASKDIKENIEEGEILEALTRGLIFVKDASAEAIPSMLPALGAAGAAAVTAPIIGAAPVVGTSAAIITRLAAPFIPGFLMGGGETYDEAKRLGATAEEAQTESLVAGGAIGLLDRLGIAAIINGIAKTYGKDAVLATFKKEIGEKGAKKVMDGVEKTLDKSFIKKNIIGETIKLGAKSGAIEGVTEGAQERIQIAAAGLAADKGMSPYDAAEISKRVIDGAALGIVGGTTMGAGTGVLTTLQHNDAVNRAKETEKEIDELREQVKDLDEDQLAKFFQTRKEEYKPSFLGELVRSSTRMLQPFAAKNKTGYEIITKLENYNNNVAKDVGNYSERLDAAFDNVRRSVKIPFFMESISKNKNNELYKALVYPDEAKKLSPQIQKAADILRQDIFGTLTQQEIKLDRRLLKDRIRNNKGIEQELQEGVKSNTITEGKAGELNNLFKNLITKYNTEIKKKKIVPNLKENPSRQESDTFRKLIKQKEFQELDEFQLVKPKGTGLYGELVNSGLEVKYSPNYLMRVYNWSPFNSKKAQKILATQENISEKMAADIVDNVRSNDGLYVPETLSLDLDKAGREKDFAETTQGIEQSRIISDETFKKLDEANLVVRDVKKITDKYLLQAIQRKNIRELKEYVEPRLKELRKSKDKPTEGEEKRIQEIYQALQNRYKPIKYEDLKKGQRWMLTYQYLLTLPLASLTALSEPIIVLTRVKPGDALFGTIKATTNTYRQALRTVLPKLKKSDSEKAFMSILQGFDGTLAERLGDIAGVDVSRRITDKFFKFIMLTQITQFSRDIAYQAIQKQIKDDIITLRSSIDAKTFTKEMADAKKRLKEQGLIDENLGLNLPDKPLTEQEFLKLPKKDLQKYRKVADKQNMTSYEVYKKIFNDKQETLLWAQGKTEGSIPPPLIRGALSKSIDEIIQTPNVINRPLWMSNPHWAWAAQLKGFMFAFGKNVGGRFYREVVQPLFKGRIPAEEAFKYALALTLIMAASMAIREGKDELRYGDEDSPHKNLNSKDRMLQAFIASNIFGPGTVLYDALNANKYGTSALLTIAGPTPQFINRWVEAMGDLKEGNTRAVSRQAARSFPGLSSITPKTVPTFADIIQEKLEPLEKE